MKIYRAWLAHTWKLLFSPCACGHGASVAFICKYVLTHAKKAFFAHKCSSNWQS